jgi:hypothetical protein
MVVPALALDRPVHVAPDALSLAQGVAAGMMGVTLGISDSPTGFPQGFAHLPPDF